MLLLVACSFLAFLSAFAPGSPFQLRTALDSERQDWTSVVVLLVGIILARFGLWVADLTITQIIQERVEQESRGSKPQNINFDVKL